MSRLHGQRLPGKSGLAIAFVWATKRELRDLALPYGVARDQSQRVLCHHKLPRRGLPGGQEVALQRIGRYTSMWIIAGRPLSVQNLGLTPIIGRHKRSADLFLRSAVRPPITTKSRGTIEQVRATLLKPQTREIPL